MTKPIEITKEAAENKRSYSNGYAAASKRVEVLKTEIARLRKSQPFTNPKEQTIEYLISTAECLIKAAELLIDVERSRADGKDSNE